MSQLFATFRKLPDDDFWRLRLAKTEVFLTEAEFLALPARLRLALERTERAFEANGGRAAAAKGLDAETQASIEDFKSRKGFWSLPTRPAQGVKPPKGKSQISISLKDLEL